MQILKNREAEMLDLNQLDWQKFETSTSSKTISVNSKVFWNANKSHKLEASL